MRPAPVLSLLIAMAAVFPPSVVNAQRRTQFDSGTVIVTHGSGEISLPPDRAVVTFDVVSRGQTAASASATNGVTVHRLVDALNAMRQPEESVQVVGVSVRPNQNYETGALRNYEAAGQVRVTIRHLDRLGRVLDLALASGATGLSDVDFRADSAEAAQGAALARAFEAARANADAIARAAGATLGPLLRVSTIPESEVPSFGRTVGLSEIRVTGGVPIAPHDIVVGATVYATWRLRPAP